LTMLMTTIPGTQLTVSSLCLGTASIGSAINEQDSFRLLDHFCDLGGSFLDTSLNYADWQCSVPSISEKTIGKWLKRHKGGRPIVVGTKGACATPERFFRLSRAEIIHDLHSSLHNLQLDCIDLFWLHRDDPGVPVASIMDVLHEQVEAGNIRYFACSNWTLDRIVEAQNYAASKGKPGFCASQILWSLAKPNETRLQDKTLVAMDERTLEFHSRTGMAVIPYSSQAGGFFSGRCLPDAVGVGGKTAAVLRDYGSAANFARLERVREVAARLNETPAAVALAYLFAHPFAVFPIIGASKPEQLTDSCRAGELRLDAETACYIEQGESDNS